MKTDNKFIKIPFLILSFSLTSLMFGGQLFGQFFIQNKGVKKIVMAVAYHEEGTWHSKGWFSIVPGGKACIFSTVKNRYYYYTGRVVDIDTKYEGDHRFLVHPYNAFDIRNSNSYASKTSYSGYEWRDFRKIDTGESTHYTLNLNNSRCTYGDCENGYGTYNWDSGNKYSGNWKNGDRHGTGRFDWSDGNSYSGDWKYGKRTGTGTYRKKSGDKYYGNFRNGEFHGKGKYTWPKGDKYDGNWRNGKFSGFGIMKFADGTKYEGNWKNDEFHGYGKVTYSDRSVKHVMYKDGEYEGAGTMHLILVMDTDDPGKVGSAAKKAKPRIKEQFKSAAKHGGMIYKEEIFSGSYFRKNKVEKYVKNFSCNPNDVVVFYYFGHGFRYSNDTNIPWPNMLVGRSGRDHPHEVGMDLEWFRKRLYNRTSARLCLVIGDCCNKEFSGVNLESPRYDGGHIAGRMGTLAPSSWRFRKLFQKYRGSVIASSSIANQYSWTSSTGSFFLDNFLEVFQYTGSTSNSGSVDWDTIFRKTKERVKAQRERSTDPQVPQFSSSAYKIS